MPAPDDFNSIRALEQTYPGAQITTYEYKPLFGITKITDPSGKTSEFVYDDAGRLRATKDTEGNKVAEYDYKTERY